MDPELAAKTEAHTGEFAEGAPAPVPEVAAGSPIDSDVIGTFHELIDGLREQIALLDEEWNIVTVNEHWGEAARQWGYVGFGPGANYRDFCKQRAQDGHPAAFLALAAMAKIQNEGRDTTSFAYTGTGPGAGRTFELCYHRLHLSGRTFTTVTRYDVTELSELRAVRERFSRSLVEEQLAERGRMAREIHDSTVQLLACIGLGLGQLKRAVEAEAPLRVVSELEELLIETQREIRSISYLSHPPELERLGLVEAMRALTAGFGRRTALEIAFEADEGFSAPSKSAELPLYRIVQEALSNVHRHAHADRAEVRLIERGSAIHVVIADNGVGFAPDASNGVGLAGMRARLSDFHGRLTVRSRPGATLIVASLLTKD